MILGENQVFASPEEALARCTARRQEALKHQFATPEEALAHFGVKGMRWGIRKDRGEFADWGKPYSPKDGLAHGSKEFELKKPKNLRVDHSNGFAVVRPVNGFASESARRVHEDLVASLVEMRKTHPNVADLKVIVVPGSHVNGGPGKSAQAAVLHTKPGEIFVMYNDRLPDFSPRKQKSWAKWVPGTKYEGYIANHEMGHVLAAAGKITPPCWDMVHSKTLAEGLSRAYAFREAKDANHKSLFDRHGVTFKELSKISPYAATSREEAFAEAVGNYYTPQTRQRMSPELQRKVKAMIDELGGAQ